ncbi:hypothetical protein GALMADRAFT_722282 [Galerina marginata CBS 339.88]|uniref:Uncharacterized protein n=1 Tax=Galerina marginata (strain CBS 339.88) TaxID=685588 RepID=A0A067SZN2_GALM3|nr:hypothetical protein GALMADRAFT_722282 [Galerina marginata CBS 339.88]
MHLSPDFPSLSASLCPSPPTAVKGQSMKSGPLIFIPTSFPMKLHISVVPFVLKNTSDIPRKFRSRWKACRS